jgi:acyl-[acyl carrier protein]--UDP-N-acetylglucosamine O-acyltransferase
VNSAFADFVKIGNDCFVAMGSNVVKDLNNGDMILASKSSVFDKESELNKRVMKSYFKV